MKIRVGVAGACGRMGAGIVKTVSQQADMELVLAVDLERVGQDVAEVAGAGRMGVLISKPDELPALLEKTKTDVLVDFTNREAALKNARTAVKKRVSLVIGTTGLKENELGELKKLINRNKTAAVISPNMATGVNIFFKLAAEAARSLGEDYDVEILEVHHHHKKDAPSGTALRAAELIARELKLDVKKKSVYGRKGMVGERPKGEIAFHAIRAGDVVGEHTMIFAGNEERIEITHRAQSRNAFINGVIRAIRFIFSKKGTGRVYTTWDVLGIK